MKFRDYTSVNFLSKWLQGILKPNLNIFSLSSFNISITDQSKCKNTFDLKTLLLCSSFYMLEIIGESTLKYVLKCFYYNIAADSSSYYYFITKTQLMKNHFIVSDRAVKLNLNHFYFFNYLHSFPLNQSNFLIHFENDFIQLVAISGENI